MEQQCQHAVVIMEICVHFKHNDNGKWNETGTCARYNIVKERIQRELIEEHVEKEQIYFTYDEKQIRRQTGNACKQITQIAHMYISNRTRNRRQENMGVQGI